MAELGEGEEVVGSRAVHGVCRGFDGDKYCAGCFGGVDGEEVVRCQCGNRGLRWGTRCRRLHETVYSACKSKLHSSSTYLHGFCTWFICTVGIVGDVFKGKYMTKKKLTNIIVRLGNIAFSSTAYIDVMTVGLR